MPLSSFSPVPFKMYNLVMGKLLDLYQVGNVPVMLTIEYDVCKCNSYPA